MIKLQDILRESVIYNSWVKPDLNMLAQEYRVEHEKKGRWDFATEKEFMEAAKNAEIKTITPSIDNQIYRRSRTRSFDELHDLIKTYASYPKYRNEEKLRRLYSRFENNLEMDMPIVFQDKNGELEIFSGNTRMDIAFQLGINPKVMIIKV